MSLGRYIRTIITITMLLTYGAGEVWAQVAADDIDIIIKVMPSGKEGKRSVTDATYGSVVATVGTLVGSGDNQYYPVTLTVTPKSSYQTKAALIVAEKMVDPDEISARRRTPGIGTFEVTGSDNTYTFNIDTKYHGAYVTVTFEKIPVAGDPTPISTLSELQNISSSGSYILTRDIDASGLTASLGEFIGTLDGNYHKLYNLGVPLFSSVNGGTVKNVTFEDVSINVENGNAGTVTALATGSARIYNCGILPSSTDYDNEGNIIGFSGSSISGSNYVGGLVGNLDEEARVINCFSYANVSGGTEVGGIVGHNNVATTSAANNQKTMVMNCMFYGEVSGTSIAPIYNGAKITNDGDDNGVNNFNYFWADASYVRSIDVYNCALSAETRYLQRFEFFRHLLNSNRELAAWWVQGTGYEKNEMAKWVLEPKQIGSNIPFPILKPFGKYPSVVNIDADNAKTTTERNKGGKLTSMGTNGMLSVTISGTGATKRADVSSLTFNLVITDKDPEHFNFNYGKVQLPYFNDYCTGNYTSTQVVTGWKIVDIITDGTISTYNSFTDNSDDAQADVNGKITTAPYNFADRNCTNKDLYNTNGNTDGSDRVFNQGAYWDVPEGVTAIEIQPYWGNARYVADACLDVVYKEGVISSNKVTIEDEMLTPSPVTAIGGGARYTNGSPHTFKDIDENEHSLTVYTSISEALSGWSPSGNVYDNALVLVGNVHNIGVSSTSASLPYTIMSVDFDHDNEPDYSYILRINNRNAVHPVRVDFLNIPGLGMAQKTTDGKGTYNLGIMNPLGWFESTNTSLFHITQFEYDHASRTTDPLILQGGVFEQWVIGQSNGVSNNTTYFHLGGNVWFKEFHRGTHQDKTYQTKHPPVSVTGGDFDEFYLTGLYRGDVANFPDNAECYINGGRFGIVAGAAMEGIGKANGNNNTGNIIWQIQNADIDEFYGGGLNATHPVEGSITTVITGGYIKQFCGGPKFGNMNAGMTVKTTANGGCIFDTFFGAGFGGNSYSRNAPTNKNYISGDYGTSNWNTWLNAQYKQQYSDNVNFKGVATTYSTQYLPMSNNVENVARLFIDYVSFSLATTRNVTSKLTDCTINKNFYGGGSLGMVDGPVTSTLTNCTVMGDVFGAGYSAKLPKVEVRNTGNFVNAPFFDDDLGAYFDPEFPGSEEYEWEHVESVTSTNAIDQSNHKLRTQENLDGLGAVTGKATLNIDGSTTVAGSVYGGGEESNVEGNTQVSICANYNDETKKWESVASSGLTITGNVFGGGKGVADSFTCEKAMVGLLDQLDQSVGNTTVVIGNGTVNGSVYGGGEVGRVEHNSTVMIGAESGTSEPTINGSVYGAGAGLVTHGYSALVRGDATVTIQGEAKVKKNVYGGGETASVGKFSVVNSLPKEPLSGGTCTVTIQGEAQIGTDGDNNTGSVYGACKGVEPDYNHATVHWKNDNQPYEFTSEEEYLSFLKTLALTSNTTVTVDGSSIVRGSVYGGGERGVTLGYVEVDMTGGTVNHDVYGGGALADTNTANWNSTTLTLTDTYYEVTGLTAGTSVVTGLYTHSESGYTKITATDAKAVDGTTYYRKTDTKVKLTGGTISGDAYGGGLGNSSTNTPAYVYGDVLVELNGETTDLGNDAFGSTPISSSSKGCVVRRIFGCNNIYGSPKGKVLVHVHSTQSGDAEATMIANVSEGDKNKVKGRYDVSAVYGGGNEAAYDPVITSTETEAAHAHTHVVIEGCDLSSIETVYGGGNAASTPSTKVEIIGSFEINEVFGGGNGKDPLSNGSENLGANVGYYTYENPDNATTEQKNAQRYGFGKAEVEIGGGIIHSVYGGSNKRGNVREVAIAMLERVSDNCFKIDEAYGGGKAAPMDGRAELKLGCIPGVGEVYGGARDADVNNDVVLTITNGTYNRIFGGNNEGHSIKGTITVNVEETGCTPIIIGQLFGGGNQAEYIAPLKSGSTTERENGPTLNLKSFTSIGEVYGGGFSAGVTGDTRININEIVGNKASEYAGEENKVIATYTDANNVEQIVKVTIPAHTDGEIGVVGNVYGGGYGADVSGNTYVNIGTESTVAYVSGNDQADKTVVGANITGDVFGGGFGASTNVTGTATVSIGEILTTEDSETHAVTVTGYKDNGAIFAAGNGIYGGSALGTVAASQLNLYAGTIAADVFGGGKGRLASGSEGSEGYVAAQGATVTTANVSLYNATVTGNIYGGCNDNGTTTTAVVNLIGGTIGTDGTAADKVFGGGKGHATTTNTATVYVGTDASTGSSNIYSNVYGGSALGAVGTTYVNLNKVNALTGNVFGGGMGRYTDGASDNAQATVTGTATVNLNDGFDLVGNIYGGCNVFGETANAVVNLVGGQVGTSSVSSNVFGGGKGSETTFATGGTIIVNMGTKSDDATPVYGGSTMVYGNIYGGSEEGSVQDAAVNLYGGTIQGDVYGGGYNTVSGKTAANDVTVKLYGTVFNLLTETLTKEGGGTITSPKTGRIFGCNNMNGSPAGNSLVHVYQTVSRTGQADSEYDLAAVFGGGNAADYKPTSGKKSTEVIIEGCDITSIQNVYGGGNAAAVPATEVWILGTKKIDNVFGGGNGERGPSYAANVGIDSHGISYGTDGSGRAYTKLVAGNITTVYGGSNSNGDVVGGSYVSMPQVTEYTAAHPGETPATGSCCTSLLADNIYGGGKNAKMSGGTNIILGCQPNHWIEEIYAGAQEADVDGDVSLTITSGMFERVFGGNKTSGKLKGSITVNIEETGDCTTPIIIGELYAGGNQAHYSIYGYQTDGTPMTADDLRTELVTNNPGKTAAEIEALFQAAKKDEPQLNVRAFTSIGAIYGGGLSAEMYADPTVSINVVKGSRNATVIGEGQYTPNTGSFHHLPYPAHASGAIGTIGNVFGGGNLATVYGSATVNIGTEEKAYFITEPVHLRTNPSNPMTPVESGDYAGLYEVVVEGANITGNVYGGGKLANITGNTQVNICAKYDEDDDEWESVTYGTGLTGVTIGSAGINDDDHGNVYGGGKGLADNFLCNKAMVGTNDAGLQAGYSDGNTSVIIGNGTVNGNVYGGGEIGRVEMNTTVTIGLPGEGTSSPDIKGDVFGGGKGDKEHGYAGLVRGNPTVTIQANAKVEHNVYGGGEIASVARYKVPRNEDDLATAHSEGYTDAVIGRPYALKDANSGFCTVTVKGNAVIGPDYAMEMTKAGGPDDAGHVFGAGKGIMPENYDYASNTVEHKPRCRANDDSWTWFADIDEYIAFIQTLALSSQTTVNIGDANDSNSKPFVKGSVYGGSENGLVQFDTNVNIIGGQIGCGKNANGQPHPDGIWADNYVPDGTDYECASWNYGKVEVNGDNRKTIYAPYDPFANAEGDLDKYPQVGTQAAKSTEGGRRIATDGHTYYGNVFGGGSGSVPYFDTTEGISKYLNSAGTVKGNTNVTISGGHILTSVYGGCEATNVLGTANVTMTGGTIGVPRKDEQILAHPVTCNLFGAGKGDQRVFFNKDTNVENAVIQINGGRIYGSVFGGGEDGHVMKNVTLTIEEKNNKTVKIGSAGTSYMDGNVFGGGRGFGGDALTAGNVGGTVTLNIKSGSVLGSVYGGGRLASVGYGLYLTTETGFGENHDDGYGKMQEDGYSDWTKGDNNEYTRTAISGFKRGYINVNISGGTIGNTVANAQYGGNVFGGSMGSIVKQDGTVNTQWDKFATAKKTTVNVTGGTIMRSVYGGGEMGTVTTDAIVNVSGGTIGDANHGGAEFGNVYGGGKGYVDPAGINYIEAGIIKGNTNVTISETDATKPTTIYHNVYGGGAYGSVGTITRNDANYVHVPGQTSVSDMPESWAENTGSSEVRVLGGTIGRNGNENGMVFGSSRGDVGAPGEIHDKLAWVKKAKVVIGATGTTGPNIKGSVYGSGENGHLFQDAVVEIHSGVVGIAEGEPIGSYTAGGASYPYRGNVYGGGCGTDKYYSNPTGVANPHDGKGDKYNPLAGIVLGDASVTMDGGTVVHNIYGAGAMGSVGTMTKDNDDHLVISSGGTTTVSISGGTVGVSGTVGDGNVFGAARGDVETTQTDVALVKTTGVTISQAEGKTTYVWGNVYGGGETGDVGTYYTITEEGANKGTNAYLEGSGACVVEVTGGTVHHNVFGAGKGESSKYECKKAMVSSTDVTIDTNAKVNGNVYGGGEVGRVEYNTVVKIGSGAGAETGGTSKPEIGGSVYGAGAGLETHGYSALVRGNSTVTVEGNAKVNGNVYGGGEKATVGKYWVSLVAQDPNEAPPSGFPDGMPYKTRDGGICTVNIQGYAQVGPDAGGSKNAGNVFGAGKGVEPSYSAGESQRMKNGDAWEKFTAEDKYLEFLQTLALASVTNVTVDGNAKVKGSVYGGSESGFVQDESFVTIKNGEIGTATYGDIYGGGRGLSNFAEAGRVKGGVTIAVDGGTAFGSVYGGGELGIVTGAVLVNINNGIIEKDVYGGGALANTNTNNWNGTTLTETYLEVGGLIAGTSSVAGYYTKSGDNYTILTTGTAVAGTKYYRKVNTTVNLLGGLIKGDAYGGGLGDLKARGGDHKDVQAMVYGDVFITLGDAAATKATAFTISNYDGTQVVKNGRVFGCNNLNGSPKGNVLVTVNKTVSLDAQGVVKAKPTLDTHTYELAAVYGGGNLANYMPVGDGRKPSVLINSCDVSIEEVYGGGNAAFVPETDVLVLGAYEIENVFGGGNGEDNYTLDGGASWITNPGADVGSTTKSGNAKTVLKGGYIHVGYGGSNSRGTIYGDISITKESGDDSKCTLNVVELYGAGKDADVEGDLILVMGCSETRTEAVYGCSMNANVKGNVELTITSGEYGKVFGGNNVSGAIFGHIIVNIEETGCTPIVIDELYGCGNDAAYSTFGYYQDGTIDGTENGKPKYVARKSLTDGTAVTFTGKPHTVPPYADPEVNVISCTRIGKVFGGGLGTGATVYGNPTVNINMIPGKYAKQIDRDGTAGADNDPNALGEVGSGYSYKDNVTNETVNVEGGVFGGGNAANVEGNTTVNIGTAEKVDVIILTPDNKPVYDTDGVTPKTTKEDVKGAYIVGNVFGGGEGRDDSFTCEKAMVNGNEGTHVNIGNGTVKGNVYGGGKVGRVENNTVVTIGLASGTSAPVIEGNVFGAGRGVNSHGYSALVRGTSTVTVQADSKVRKSVYGGGETASVGKYKVVNGLPEVLDDSQNPYSGYCYVTIKGNAEIGPDDMQMTAANGPDDTGHVFGAGKGILPYEGYGPNEKPYHMNGKQHLVDGVWDGKTWEDDPTYYDAYNPTKEDAAYFKFVRSLALATHTDVTIGGNAFVKGSVYGGSENGFVQRDTKVTIQEKCQIGNGNGVNRRYTETEWTQESLPECASWPYGEQVVKDGKTVTIYAPYDKFARTDAGHEEEYSEATGRVTGLSTEGGRRMASDGHTFYGNVFGGGSGLTPYKPGKWFEYAGVVHGNSTVEITGGHILTSVYGGNENTDVKGTSTVKMSGGTLGVPRTVEQITKHPVTCYLFGAGKGDQRVFFNTWTNVENAIVEISGDARIYGSVFGGGEDGHILKDSKVTIKENALIGTTGTSYVDGNIFGAGRGFSGDAQTAGTVGGNVEINISGGKMLGSVYGGGRLASVGTDFTAPNDPNYGQFREDDADGTYGHVTVNISGGTIGNTVGNAESGNVFGGSMGRLNLLSGNINPIWPKMAQVKETTVTISGDAVIKRNVYGGGELGTVRDNATVTINGGTVNRDVYGAGYGSKDYETKTKITVKMPKEGVTNPTSASDYDDVNYVFTPMIFAGCVGQNTYVNIAGGKVRKSVYGGGEMASVGIMDCRVKIDNNATDPVYTEGTDKYVYEHFHSHLDENNGFALSWPFHFENAPGYFGETHVNITGGRIGVANGDTDINTDNGDVYGGGKGIAGEYKNYVYCANVGSAEVTIDYPAGNTATPQNYMTNADIECIAGAVYGGAENGHVMGDTKLTLKNGLIGHSMYGGGSGKGTFSTTLLKIGSTSEHYTRDIYSFTAGKVFGNSTVEMSGGTVVRNVYGGGNMGSVGKGNYAGGADDYSTSGYGEKLSGNLWDNVSKESQAFLTSGICTVNITGGTVGYIDESDPSNSMYPWNSTASLPYGNVFGGCRGESAPNIVETPRYLYSPEFFVGYANETAVTIGKTDGSGPTILGSVYGGGMDGHIRRDASVTILGGEIGIPFTEANKTKVKTSDLNDIQWLARGNVYGSGSGIGKYKYDFDYDGKYESTVKYNNGRATVDTKEEDYSTSAGSVTRFTTVDIKGGTIHRNVYGGGSLSSIGAPKIGQSYDPYHPSDSEHSSEVGKQSLNKVTISGGQIGDADCLTSGYGGDVNGGSRGAMAFENSLANPASFANSVYTEVTISDDADVKGNVFGGGEAGIVKHDTEVKMQGGTVGNDLYGGGDLADVGGNTTVLLTGGTISNAAYGGARGTAEIAAKVGGDVLVDLNNVATSAKGCVVDKIFGANNVNGTPEGHVKVHVHATQNRNLATVSNKSTAENDYDVSGVFGGGNNADYVPTDTKQSTEVIIEGCDLTSIFEVYGGGYGAATPGTNVLVKGTKIIDNVFGGGYGAGANNPGANVGYRTDKTAYGLDINGSSKMAVVQLMAGHINNVYGGSNTKGDIRGGSSITNLTNTGETGTCSSLDVGKVYGGGKDAEMKGGAEIVLGCMPDDWIEEIYAGAENADVGSDVSLTITSGKFGRVFGGNKTSGRLHGSITVNIEENPDCDVPIIIGELYGGGNQAPYSIYGYKNQKDSNGKWIPREKSDYDAMSEAQKEAEGIRSGAHNNPQVNVRSFTSIGNIFGGGYGEHAVMVGSPTININEVILPKADGTPAENGYDPDKDNAKPALIDGTNVKLYPHEAGKMGVISTVFGGGNAAKVIGDTHVNIGTTAEEPFESLRQADGSVPKKAVAGADIRGNVYGGGNNAEVTGKTDVVIGQKKE